MFIHQKLVYQEFKMKLNKDKEINNNSTNKILRLIMLLFLRKIMLNQNNNSIKFNHKKKYF